MTLSAPTARGLTEQKGFWVEVKPDSFIPGFAQQLIGAKAGDQRTVTVDFPNQVVEAKEKILPELNDAFAQTCYGAENLEKLREGVRKDLQNENNLRQKRSI